MRKNYIYLFFCVFLFVSCKKVLEEYEKDKVSSLKGIVEKSLGKELILPDSLRLYKPFSTYVKDSVQISNSNFKIYSFINTSCSTCLSNINEWNKIANEFEKYNIPIILIFGSDDEFELIQYLFKSEEEKIDKFPYPFFLDYKNQYIELNKFMSNDIGFQTVLTNKKNIILLMGSPIYSKDIKELYKKELLKRKNL